MDVTTAVIESPIGPLALAMTASGLVRLDLGGSEDSVRDGVARRFGDTVEFGTRVAADATIGSLRRYFEGELDALDEVPVDPGGTPFQNRVWLELRAIRAGETWSYSQLARAVDRPDAVRAVGAANGANPIPLVLPCHRVIGANGALVGYGGGLPRKQWLLEHERARFSRPTEQLSLL